MYQHTFPREKWNLEDKKVNYSFLKSFWNYVYNISQVFSALKPNSRSFELNVGSETDFYKALDQTLGYISS